MTRSSTNELFTPYKEPEREFRSSRRHFKTLSLDKLRSPNFNILSDQDYSKEEVAQIMAKTIEQYMSKTRANYGSWVARPKIKNKDNFELKGQLLKELRTNTFSGSDHEDANEHTEKVLEIVDLFHIPNITINHVMLRAFHMYLTRAMHELILFYNGLRIPTRQILDSRGAIPSKSAADAKVAIQEMAEYSQKCHNETSKSRSTETSHRLAAIQAQLNNLGREIKKVNEKVYAAQVGCEQCKGTYYTKYCPLKEEGKTLEESYYTQFGGPFQEGGYKAATPRFYQIDNVNPLYQEKMQSMEDTLSKFMRASIKTLKIHIGQVSKVLQERGFGSLPSSTEANLRDQVKSISTTIEADSCPIRHIGSAQYVDKMEYKGNNVVGTLMNVPIFVGTISVVTNFVVLENIDAYPDERMCDVIVGDPFLKEVRIKARRIDGTIALYKDDKSVTYQMA
nr:hypothetical protein [Tanacetum cinerariifolium]